MTKPQAAIIDASDGSSAALARTLRAEYSLTLAARNA